MAATSHGAMSAAMVPASRQGSPKTKAKRSGPTIASTSAAGTPIPASTNASRRKSGRAAAGSERACSDIRPSIASPTLVPITLSGRPEYALDERELAGDRQAVGARQERDRERGGGGVQQR